MQLHAFDAVIRFQIVNDNAVCNTNYIIQYIIIILKLHYIIINNTVCNN